MRDLGPKMYRGFTEEILASPSHDSLYGFEVSSCQKKNLTNKPKKQKTKTKQKTRHTHRQKQDKTKQKA